MTPIHAISDLIESIGLDSFAERLMSLFNGLTRVDSCRVYARQRCGASNIVFAAGSSRDFGMVEIATIGNPDHGLSARLYRSALSDGLAEDILTIGSYSQLVMNALHRHLAFCSVSEPTDIADEDVLSVDRRGKMLEQISLDLVRVGTVSPREAEVCAHIALGYSIHAISLTLGISENTAATHRKRAYSKLGISSQNELFARYLNLSRSDGENWRNGSRMHRPAPVNRNNAERALAIA